MKTLSTFICLFGVFFAGSSRADEKPAIEIAREILSKAADWELLAIDPNPPRGEPKDGFHEWEVLGRTKVKDDTARKGLLAALNKGIAEWEKKKEKEREEGLLTAGGCFQPRHGIRATHDGKTIDILICFECAPVHIWINGKETIGTETSKSPQDTFDDVLRKAKVPMGPRLSKD